jgi:hypothetical protein
LFLAAGRDAVRVHQPVGGRRFDQCEGKIFRAAFFLL